MTLATSLLEVPLLRNRGGTAAAGAKRACRASALRQTQHHGQQRGLRRKQLLAWSARCESSVPPVTAYCATAEASERTAAWHSSAVKRLFLREQLFPACLSSCF